VTVESALRTRARALLFDGAGTSPWTLAATHLHSASPDARRVEDHPEDSFERAVELRFLPRAPLGRVNPITGYAIYRQRILVRVGYLISGAGGDDPERAGEQSGAGTDDAVEDRAATDRHLIENVLGWQANWSSVTDPTVIDCDPDGDGAEDTTEGARRVVVTPFLLTYRAQLPGSYGPSL
jgi:hypothetical protein